MPTGALTQPRNQTVASANQQTLVKRFNTGLIPAAGEIAKSGGTKDIDIDGFVQKADIKQIRVFAAGLDPTNFDIELFSKKTSDGAPCTDQYRQYQWQGINTQDIDAAGEPIIIEDEELVDNLGTKVAKKQLHVRITNNSGANTMHVTDIEIEFCELIAV